MTRAARALVAALVPVCALVSWAGSALAQASLVESSASARTIPAGRLEVAVFQPLRYGLRDDVELSTQPLVFLMPQLEAKVAWWSRAPYSLASTARLSYPTPLLDVLAREGSLGLLPADSDVPQAVILDADGLATAEWEHGHLATLSAGVSVAPRESADRMPLLDFPFLYARFAVLKTPIVYRVGLGYEGMLGERLRVAADVKYFGLPVIDGGFSVEPGLSLRWLVATHVALEAGARFEYAAFPVGNRFHYLPFVDLLLAW